MEKCKYCSGELYSNEPIIDSYERKLENHTVLVISRNHINCYFGRYKVKTEINYCPMCGRKLE